MVGRVDGRQFNFSVLAALRGTLPIVLVPVAGRAAPTVEGTGATTTVGARRSRTLIRVWRHDAFSVRCGSLAGWKKLASLNTRTTEGSHNRAQPGASTIAAQSSSPGADQGDNGHSAELSPRTRCAQRVLRGGRSKPVLKAVYH